MSKQRWAFLLYDYRISGGANVIFEHAYYASKQGVDVTFITISGQGKNEASWHPHAAGFNYAQLDKAKECSFDVVIATEWRSAYDAGKLTAKKYIYFVQSLESRFFKDRECLLAYLADNSYELPFVYITEAHWIRDYLKQQYGQSAVVVRNGIDKGGFRPDGRGAVAKKSNKLRFLVEGSVHNWLKNVDKTIMLCRKAGVDELWLVTPDNITDYQGADRVFSRVRSEKMPEIYRSCDVLVKLSLVEGMFGPPLEMFHCGGTAIVYDVEGADEYIESGVNSIMIKKNDEEAVLAAIRQVKADRLLLDRLKTGASKTAAEWPGWEQASQVFFETVAGTSEQDPKIREILRLKAQRGSKAYRDVESVFGAEPSNDRISELIKSNDGRKVVLYGAGALCKYYIIKLASAGIPIERIVVTDVKNNPRTVLGHSVIDIDELNADAEQYTVFITTEKYHQEIYASLLTKGYNHIV